jgi:hypothetical protein
MSGLIFKEKQQLLLVWVVAIIVFLVILILGFGAQGLSNENGKKFPVFAVYFNLALIGFLFLLSYNFQIKLSTEKLELKFGIGILKKSFKVSEIDRESIQIVTPSKWYGIGWRYNFNGDMIFNAKYAKAVCFKMKNKHKKYYVGADDYEKLKRELILLVPKD